MPVDRQRDSRRARLRRARCIWAYWKDGHFSLDNYRTRAAIQANPVTIEVLHAFETWQRPERLPAILPEYSAASLQKSVRELLRHEFLVQEGSRQAVEDENIEREWAPWLPEGGYHFATKDTPYIGTKLTLEEKIRSLPSTPQPAFFKSYPRAKKIALPQLPIGDGEFERVLLSRRTHRTFASGKLALDQVSQLLGHVWGVKGNLSSPIFGDLPLKTSPSGGARHPGEVYLMALRVEGLAQGLYHYDPVGHRLETIRTGPMRDKASKYCVGQRHPPNASALFLMTAVFDRSMWKYHLARAYRVVLLDAGHLCQTFCLVATWLGLGPFCTAALKDSLIEDDLRIDGVKESVLYVAGVGFPSSVESKVSGELNL